MIEMTERGEEKRREAKRSEVKKREEKRREEGVMIEMTGRRVYRFKSY